MPTIGILVTIPEPAGEQLRDYRAGLGDPEAHMVPAHITVMPPVDVEPSLMPEIERHLGDVMSQHRGFTVALAGTGTFRPVSPVVFVAVEDGASELSVLSGAVRTGPLDIEAQFPYHPHVTVAHRLDDQVMDRAATDLADFEFEFDVDAVELYHFDPETGWVLRRSFPLS